MKFSGSIDIDRPIELVVKFFADPTLLKEYQEGFLRKDLVKGTAGEKGAVSKMYYVQGKGEMELTETVLANNLPDSFEAFYHHKHMDNTLKFTFTALGDGRTRYAYQGEYVRMNMMPKIISVLFPNMFRKPALRWMQNFKTFVEAQPRDISK